MLRSNKLTKTVRCGTAVLTCAAFTFTLEFFPARPAGAAEIPSTVSVTLPADFSTVLIPAELGKIDDYFTGSSKERVIVVQDAHAIPDAQRSIRKAILYFYKQYGVNLIGLEGASASLDARMLKSFPDKDQLNRVLGEYFDQGELAGGVAAAISGIKIEDNSAAGSRLNFQGVEDWPVYENALEFYLAALQKEAGIFAVITPLKKQLQDGKKAHYSPALQKVDQALLDFRENQNDFLKTLEVLAAVKTPEQGSELALLLEQGKKEKQGSGGKDSTAEVRSASTRRPTRQSMPPVGAEVRTLSAKVENYFKIAVSSAETKTLQSQFQGKKQQFQTSQISAEAFALAIKDVADKAGIRIQVSDQLLGFVKKEKSMRDIEGTKLFADFERYGQSVKASLFQNEQDRELDRRDRRLWLAEKMAKLEISHEDWVEFEQMRRDGNWTVDGQKMTPLETLFEPHFAFYKNSEQRDDIFLKNLKAQMEKSRTAGHAAVMVAGGFHAHGLCSLLKEKGISYALVMPAIKNLPDESHYRAQMRGDFSWKNYFEVENGKVNLYNAFIRGTRDRLLGLSRELSVVSLEEKQNSRAIPQDPRLLKNWRDQIIRDLSDEGRIEKAGDYTRFIDELSGDEKDKAIKKRLAQVDKFLEDLKKLDAQGQFTAPNIAKLFQPSMAQTFAVASLTGASVPQRLLPGGLASTSHVTPKGLAASENRTLREQPEAVVAATATPASVAVPAGRSEMRGFFENLAENKVVIRDQEFKGFLESSLLAVGPRKPLGYLPLEYIRADTSSSSPQKLVESLNIWVQQKGLKQIIVESGEGRSSFVVYDPGALKDFLENYRDILEEIGVPVDPIEFIEFTDQKLVSDVRGYLVMGLVYADKRFTVDPRFNVLLSPDAYGRGEISFTDAEKTEVRENRHLQAKIQRIIQTRSDRAIDSLRASIDQVLYSNYLASSAIPRYDDRTYEVFATGVKLSLVYRNTLRRLGVEYRDLTGKDARITSGYFINTILPAFLEDLAELNLVVPQRTRVSVPAASRSEMQQGDVRVTQAVNISEILRESVALHAMLGYSMQFKLELPAQDLWAYDQVIRPEPGGTFRPFQQNLEAAQAYAETLRTALSEIYTNAAQGRNVSGAPAITIQARLDELTDQLIIEASDNGPGVDAGVSAEGLSSTKGAGQGKGLQAIHSYLAQLGGTVSITTKRVEESESEHGTIVRLAIPARTKSASRSEVRQADSKQAVPERAAWPDTITIKGETFTKFNTNGSQAVIYQSSDKKKIAKIFYLQDVQIEKEVFEILTGVNKKLVEDGLSVAGIDETVEIKEGELKGQYALVRSFQEGEPLGEKIAREVGGSLPAAGAVRKLRNDRRSFPALNAPLEAAEKIQSNIQAATLKPYGADLTDVRTDVYGSGDDLSNFLVRAEGNHILNIDPLNLYGVMHVYYMALLAMVLENPEAEVNLFFTNRVREDSYSAGLDFEISGKVFEYQFGTQGKWQIYLRDGENRILLARFPEEPASRGLGGIKIETVPKLVYDFIDNQLAASKEAMNFADREGSLTAFNALKSKIHISVEQAQNVLRFISEPSEELSRFVNQASPAEPPARLPQSQPAGSPAVSEGIPPKAALRSEMRQTDQPPVVPSSETLLAEQALDLNSLDKKPKEIPIARSELRLADVDPQLLRALDVPARQLAAYVLEGTQLWSELAEELEAVRKQAAEQGNAVDFNVIANIIRQKVVAFVQKSVAPSTNIPAEAVEIYLRSVVEAVISLKLEDGFAMGVKLSDSDLLTIANTAEAVADLIKQANLKTLIPITDVRQLRTGLLDAMKRAGIGSDIRIGESVETTGEITGAALAFGQSDMPVLVPGLAAASANPFVSEIGVRELEGSELENLSETDRLNLKTVTSQTQAGVAPAVAAGDSTRFGDRLQAALIRNLGETVSAEQVKKLSDILAPAGKKSVNVAQDKVLSLLQFITQIKASELAKSAA